MPDYLEIEREGPIAWIYLNRPEKRNALTDALLRELIDEIGKYEDDQSVRAIVLGGRGNAFCAGFDLTYRKDPNLSPAEWLDHARLANRAYWSIWSSRIPFVSMVHGSCLGGGCELAVVCDITVASADATFGEPEVRFGTGPLFNAIPMATAFKSAMRLLLTGEIVDAHEAKSLGLVTSVVATGDLLGSTRKVAERLAMSPPSAVTSFKRAVQRIYEAGGFRAVMDATAEQFAFVQLETEPERSQFRDLAKKEGFAKANEWLERKQREMLAGGANPT